MRGSRAAPRTNLIQLVELTPQHLALEVRRVTSRRSFGGFERFTEIAKQSFDVVSFDDQGTQLESAMVEVCKYSIDLKLRGLLIIVAQDAPQPLTATNDAFT
jgi:hypothetical protein